MFMKIMAAIDGSETSMRAIMEAKRLAASREATLRIVYAVTDSEEADQQTGRKLLKQAQSAVGTDLTVETRLLQAEAIYGLNGIAEAIAGAANEWGADLVVMGSSNRRGLERWVIGSVAEQLLSKVDASVLLVRPHQAAD
jgi:nucleotide-binding universal stress UspA family protein